MYCICQGCLKTNPEERLTIDQVIRAQWIAVSSGTLFDSAAKYKLKYFQQYNAVPQTPLLTSDVLKEETEQWLDVQQGMSLALREMRVDQVRESWQFLSSISNRSISSLNAMENYPSILHFQI